MNTEYTVEDIAYRLKWLGYIVLGAGIVLILYSDDLRAIAGKVVTGNGNGGS